MAYTPKTVLVGTSWTLITSSEAMLQFNDKMFMNITDTNTAPTEPNGFVMEEHEKYVNSSAGIYVWAKSIAGGSEHESVRVVENIL